MRLRPCTKAISAISRGQAGMSLIELLIAFFIMLVMLLGILPLFAQAMMGNQSGRRSSDASSYAKSRAEQLYQLPFTHTLLDVQGGTERKHYEHYMNGAWQVGTNSPPAGALWTRTTTVRQFNISDLTTPLPAGSDPRQVHVKEILVEVAMTASGTVLGPGKSVDVRVLKSQ